MSAAQVGSLIASQPMLGVPSLDVKSRQAVEASMPGGGTASVTTASGAGGTSSMQ